MKRIGKNTLGRMKIRQYWMATKWLGRMLPAALVLVGVGFSLPSQGLEFPKTGGRGAPTRSVGGGTRGEQCLASQRGALLLNALTPPDEQITLTASNPNIPTSLFFYVPEVMDSKEGELYIGDDEGNEIHRQTVSLGTTPGILEVEIPTQDEVGNPLYKVDTDYEWEFSVVCDPLDREQDRIVQGSLRRVLPSETLNAQLKTTSAPLQQAELYANEGIWQEALTLAAQLNPTNAKPWQDLLTSVGLQDLANEPFIDN